MEDGGTTSPNPTYPGPMKRWHFEGMAFLVAAVEVVSVVSAVLVTACFTIGNRVWPRVTGCLYMPERVLPGSITSRLSEDVAELVARNKIAASLVTVLVATSVTAVGGIKLGAVVCLNTPDWVCLIFNNRTPLEKHK